MAGPSDRLTLMSTFVRITERGSISAAAVDLGITQATASRQLAALEDRLGVQLAERTTHSLTLTENGKSVLTEAHALLSQWEGLEERLSDDRDALAGPIKLVVPIALGRSFLCDAVLEFAQRHPEITINLVLDDRPGLAAEEGYDLLVKVGRPVDDTLIVREVTTVERGPVASAQLGGDQDVSFDKLEEMPFVSLGTFEGASIPLRNKTGEVQTVKPTPVWATNDIFALRDAIVAGRGWGILPTWLIGTELGNSTLIPLARDWIGPALPVTLSLQPSRRSIRRIQALAAVLTERLTAEIEKNAN
ncbi:MAG: LysR family transcriptional regulator [Pseudomonadota bacterium]